MSRYRHLWTNQDHNPPKTDWHRYVLCWAATGIPPQPGPERGTLNVATAAEDVDCPECIEWMHA